MRRYYNTFFMKYIGSHPIKGTFNLQISNKRQHENISEQTVFCMSDNNYISVIEIY